MDGILGLLRMAKRVERLLEQRLQIHLPRVDDVERPFAASERWRARVAFGRRRRPQRPAVRLRRESAVLEIAAEETELPELVRDVLADVGHDAVRPHDHFFARLFFSLG